MEEGHNKENVPQAMKIAVALAVLRNKPAGVSGSRYAEILCEKFRASQLHWKQQYQRAEAELLHLKQQLMMSTHSNQQLNNDQEVHATDIQIAEDSLPSSSQTIFPTPPPSGSAGMSQSTSTRPSPHPQISLAKHTEFLHHVINIQTASKHLSLDDSLQDITQQSLLHSLQLIQNHIGDDEISWTVQEQCVQSIVVIVEKCNKHNFNIVFKTVTNLCSHIIDDIMSYSKNNNKVQEKRSHLLSSFCDCKLFTPILLNLLCEAIHSYTNILRTCAREKEQLDANKFCNSYYLIRTVENCLCTRLKELGEVEKVEIRTKLEDSLLYISERFPLFAHVLWKLCALLS